MGKLIDILNEALPLGIINETGLSRLLQSVNGKDIAIASAWKDKYTRRENKIRQRRLHSMLNIMDMGGYRLVGYWQETSDVVDYKDVDSDDLKDIVEDAVLFIKPDDVDRENFIDLIVRICRKFEQDTVVVGLNEGGEHEYAPTNQEPDDHHTHLPNMNLYLYDQGGDRQKIGDKLSLNKIAQAYSRMRGKENVPYVFEGILHPTNNFGRWAFKVRNILYEKKSNKG